MFFWCPFGVLWASLGITFGALFGVLWASFWRQLGVLLPSFWRHLWHLMGVLRASSAAAFLSSAFRSFCTLFLTFGIFRLKWFVAQIKDRRRSFLSDVHARANVTVHAGLCLRAHKTRRASRIVSTHAQMSPCTSLGIVSMHAKLNVHAGLCLHMHKGRRALRIVSPHVLMLLCIKLCACAWGNVAVLPWVWLHTHKCYHARKIESVHLNITHNGQIMWNMHDSVSNAYKHKHTNLVNAPIVSLQCKRWIC